MDLFLNMKLPQRLIAVVFLWFAGNLYFSQNAFSQKREGLKWDYSVSKTGLKPGEEAELIFSAKIDKDWYVYSSDFKCEMGPVVASFEFQKNDSYQLLGEIKPVGAKRKHDDIFGCDVSTFKGTAEFRQKVKILKANPIIKGSFEYQMCSDITGQCILFDPDFEFRPVTKAAATEEKKDESQVQQGKTDNNKETAVTAAGTDIATSEGENKTGAETETNSPGATDETRKGEENTSAAEDFEDDISGKNQASILSFMLLAFLGGMAALLTPCVFPMIPMTVAFFTKQKDKKQGRLRALFYGFSIILVYTLSGTLVAVFMGPEFGNWLSTAWLPNILFFLIFIIFGASFLGMFEITLPSGFINNVDKKADVGGYVGVFFMAFTLVLVSFSCTGPIVGTLLIEAFGGSYLKPVMGMFAFSMAFAIPFTLFAFFPQWLNALPKSGGWLNSVKVTLGFLEIAFAFKFLSVADQTYHWGLLDREVYLAIWIVIFTLLGFYFLGKLKFSHDSDTPYISVPRLGMAILAFAFVVYLFPGMFGAPLRALSGYLPPQSSLDFDLTMEKNPGNYAADDRGKVRFAEFMPEHPHKIHGFYDYKQALEYAKTKNKPVFIDFTGHGCVNCREMEANVWSHPEVLKRLKEDYVVVALYADDKTELPEAEWYTSSFDQKVKKTIGKQNLDFQITRFNENAQPLYILVDADGNPLTNNSGQILKKAYDQDVEKFIKFLDKGKEEFKKNARYNASN